MIPMFYLSATMNADIEDAFSNNLNWWFSDSSMVIRNGQYEFYSTTGAAYSWMKKLFTDGSIQTETMGLGGLDTHG